ncbi:flagellar hook protein FlgE [Caulobacter sp. KR2-114]|uniref:flagellar hook protein FlgE n=1 Tax=Caulobacter sp. KR2-114 TaxID=3400912 RepID=UPI003C0603D1
MSLNSALNSAVSGLRAQSSALSAISSNIANASTTGYKVEGVTFDSLVSASAATSTSLSSSDASTGDGVSTSTYRDMTSHGEVTSTTDSTNMAIDGTGFFVVSGSTTDVAPATDLYTRDGSFDTDGNGYLVNSSGDFLLGYATDASGAPTNASAGTLSGLQPVQIPTTTTVAATTTASMAANLPAGLAVGSSVTSSMEVVDSLGVTQTIGQTWTKTAANTWTLTLANPYSTDPSTSTGTISPSSITVNFDGNGVLTSTNPDPVSLTLSGMTSGAADSTFSLNLGTAGKTDGLTQYASSDSTNEISITSNTHDGSTAGSLSSVSVGDDGLITAKYSNNTSIIVAKVPVATFVNQQGLSQLSGSTFMASNNSGSAVLSSAGADGAGSIVGSALEASATDTATEFNKMIVAQQAYSAAAQVVTSVEKMFQTLIQTMG